MGKIENFRKVLALPEVMDNVDLTNKLRELQQDYFELLEKNNELSFKLKEIEDISDIKKNAKINPGGFYTLDGVKDTNGNEIRFCVNCLYEYGLQMPMMYGLLERGWEDILTGTTISHNVFGYCCKKCNTKLIASNKGEN